MGQVLVFRSTSELVNSSTVDENETPYSDMQTYVDEYWGGENNERWFVIPFWRVRQLMLDSDSTEIALKVTNIDDPATVDATWVSFNPDDPGKSGVPEPSGPLAWLQSLLQGLESLFNTGPDMNLYVFGENLFPLEGGTGFNFFEPANVMSVLGRIGQDEDGNIFVFFTVGQIRPRPAPGTSGGASSGARIPADGTGSQ